ncbi:hypothetical protein [Novosphingobium resinovorum]|uniref:hypothetical protein n=1 Tax=Novosphingobium resinovorum TaxID=158500 RepID=UPI003D2A4B44
MRAVHLLAGGALALTSVWAVAQDSPESLLPKMFDEPAPARSATPRPQAPRTQAPKPQTSSAPSAAASSAPRPAATSTRWCRRSRPVRLARCLP